MDKLLLFFWTDSRRSKNGNRLADTQKLDRKNSQKPADQRFKSTRSKDGENK